jgi:TQO small subunit DoxD
MANARATVDRLSDRLDRSVLALFRIVLGLLWLANLEWKRPPDFGEINKNGLYKYVDSAVRLPVFAPFAWFIENIVMKQYRLFGWVTLLLEVLLAASLLLGWHTRIMALLGAGLSVNIMLSVLYYDKQYEWPWSYYLMIFGHLAIFAAGAGRTFGLDGLRKRGAPSHRNAVTLLGAVAVVVGIAGVYVSRSKGFTSGQGAMVGWAHGELKFVWFNIFSAILTIVFGLVAIAGARLGRTVGGFVAALGFALMSLQVILQWRYNSKTGVADGGFLGATGGTLGFWVMLAIGFAAASRAAAPENT